MANGVHSALAVELVKKRLVPVSRVPKWFKKNIFLMPGETCARCGERFSDYSNVELFSEEPMTWVHIDCKTTQ